MTNTLTRHADIQTWVAGKKGLPAIRRVPDRFGRVHPRLTLSFAGRKPAPSATPTQDDGMSPVSWSAWFAELDRQHLALRVKGEDGDYELVERKNLN